MSSIPGCLSSFSYYLCCGCCSDKEDTTAVRRPLITPDGLDRDVTPISPAMNGRHHEYGSLGESSQPVAEHAAERVSALTETVLPPPASSPTSPSLLSGLLTPPSSPGSDSDTERSPFNWKAHAQEHESPKKN